MIDLHAQRSIRCFRIYQGRFLVLRIEDQPGKLYSTLAPGPDGPPDHRFISLQAYDMASEDQLGRLMRQAHSFDEYLESLISAGFDAMSCYDPPSHDIGVGFRLRDAKGLAGALWRGAGQFSSLWWQPEEGKLVFEHATLTTYRQDTTADLLAHLRATATFAALQLALTQGSYQLLPM